MRKHLSFEEALKQGAYDAGLGEEYESVQMVQQSSRAGLDHLVIETVARKLFVTGGTGSVALAALPDHQSSSSDWSSRGVAGGIGAGGVNPAAGPSTSQVPVPLPPQVPPPVDSTGSSVLGRSWSVSSWGRRVESVVQRPLEAKVAQLELRHEARRRTVSAGIAMGLWSSSESTDAAKPSAFGFHSWYKDKDSYIVGLNALHQGRPRPIVWRGSRYHHVPSDKHLLLGFLFFPSQCHHLESR